LAALVLWVSGPSAAAACDQDRADIGGYALWMHVAGEGPMTVVFESGGGENSSAWAGVEPAVRALGVRTVLYDRAGLGRSDPASSPYSVVQEAEALSTALTACGVEGPIVIASHSYGGFITALVAAADPRVAGVVLIDANIGDYFDEAAAQRVVARFTPQFEGLSATAPDLARVLIPVIEAYPESARRVREAPFSTTLPIVDVVAETSWAETPQEREAMRAAHAAFAAASPAREAVYAEGSGHNVMHDRADVVIAAIARMVARVIAD
jgi:pimeloyl-ACP methyl ester carboxylesterase